MYALNRPVARILEKGGLLLLLSFNVYELAKWLSIQETNASDKISIGGEGLKPVEPPCSTRHLQST